MLTKEQLDRCWEIGAAAPLKDVNEAMLTEAYRLGVAAERKRCADLLRNEAYGDVYSTAYQAMLIIERGEDAK